MEERQRVTKKEQLIAISTGTVLRVIFVLLIFVFLYLIRDIVAIFFAGLFLAALIDPFADFFERYRIPRGLAVVLVYVVGISALVGALILVLPPVLAELHTFLTVFAPFISQASGQSLDLSLFGQNGLSDNLQNILSTVRGAGLPAAVPQILSIGSAAFGGIFAVVIVLMLAFYLVVEKNALVKAASFVTPEEYQPFVALMSMKVRQRLGAWLRGELVLMLVIFLLVYLALTLLGVQYALVLALLAGLLEVIPFLGPFMAAIPAVVLALNISPLYALLTVVSYIVIQNVEANVLVPKIMQKATGINPIVSLIAVLIGFRLGGVVGAILSIPLANAIEVCTSEIFRRSET